MGVVVMIVVITWTETVWVIDCNYVRLWLAEWERDGNTDVLYLCGLIYVCHKDDNTYPLPPTSSKCLYQTVKTVTVQHWVRDAGIYAELSPMWRNRGYNYYFQLLFALWPNMSCWKELQLTFSLLFLLKWMYPQIYIPGKTIIFITLKMGLWIILTGKDQLCALMSLMSHKGVSQVFPKASFALLCVMCLSEVLIFERRRRDFLLLS